MPAAYSYSRFSDMAQAKGRSEARQNDGRAEAWCVAHGYTLDTAISLRDRGKSGYHGDHLKGRSRLAVFLQVVADGQIPRGSALIIEHLDRLSRMPWQEGLQLIQRLLGAGIEIVTLMDGQRYTAERLAKDMGCIFILLMHLCQSNEESDKKSGRLKDVWKDRREQTKSGKRANRRCPSWLDPTTLEVIPEKAGYIRLIYKYALDGDGPNLIASKLNKDRTPTMQFGTRWSAHTVRHFLTSRTVLGEYQNKRMVDGVEVNEGDPIAGFYPAIIDPTDFAQVQRLLADRSKRQTRGKVADQINLFRGLLYSLYDGGRYHLQSNPRRMLIPYARTEGVPDSLPVSIYYQSFEDSFFRFVREVDTVTLFSPKGSQDKATRLERAQMDLSDVVERIATTKARIKSSKNIDVLLSLLEEMEGDRKGLVKEIEDLRSQLVTSEAQIFSDLRSILADPLARTKIASTLRLLVDRVNLLPILRKVGRWRMSSYLLYTEVHFNNGQIRFFVVDEDGAEMPQVGFARTGYTILGDQAAVDTTRRVILPPLILEATPEWRDKLGARFPGLPASTTIQDRYANARMALGVFQDGRNGAG